MSRALPFDTIIDVDDPRLDWFALNERALSTRPQRRNDDAPGRFLAEGDLVVERALAAGCVPVAAVVDPQHIPDVAARIAEVLEAHDDEGQQVFVAGDAVRQRVATMGRMYPIVALFERPPRPSVAAVAAETDRLVVLEAVDNPANVGAIVRNAAGLGWGGLVLDHTSADPLSRRALRVAMGTAFALAHARTTDLPGALDELRADGYTTVALTLHPDAGLLDDVDRRGRIAMVIGSERAGVSAELLAKCERRVRIPMHQGVDSLNAANAAAIACYALRSAG